MRGVFRLNRVVSRGSLERWKVVRRAISHRVTRFPGVAVVAHDVPCSKFPVRRALCHGTPNATPLRFVRYHAAICYRAFTLVTVRLVT